jgi:hypothetical protein
MNSECGRVAARSRDRFPSRPGLAFDLFLIVLFLIVSGRRRGALASAFSIPALDIAAIARGTLLESIVARAGGGRRTALGLIVPMFMHDVLLLSPGRVRVRSN